MKTNGLLVGGLIKARISIAIALINPTWIENESSATHKRYTFTNQHTKDTADLLLEDPRTIANGGYDQPKRMKFTVRISKWSKIVTMHPNGYTVETVRESINQEPISDTSVIADYRDSKEEVFYLTVQEGSNEAEILFGEIIELLRF